MHWVHPLGRETNWGPNLQGKVVSAPQGRARVHLLQNWGDLGGGRGYLGSFSVFFEGDN